MARLELFGSREKLDNATLGTHIASQQLLHRYLTLLYAEKISFSYLDLLLINKP
ncbi:MAG: hypothetical protein CENE_02129 [Candidatus Celerinatantimonas neptuna]|nr:MAG: hypothetical protein CENE_02129 [Candidatus Celerinatantimonas neptuna]